MAADAALLEGGGRNDFRFGDELTFPPVKVDRVLKDGDRVELGGASLTALHTPGHTKGSTTFVTHVEDGGTRRTVVFVTSLSVNPGTALINNAKYPSILEDWEKTYRVVRSLAPDVWLSAHTRFFDMAGKARRVGGTPNPYIDPEGYRQYVESSERRFRQLLTEQGSAAKTGGAQSGSVRRSGAGVGGAGIGGNVPELPRLGFPELFALLVAVLLLWSARNGVGPRDWR